MPNSPYRYFLTVCDGERRHDMNLRGVFAAQFVTHATHMAALSLAVVWYAKSVSYREYYDYSPLRVVLSAAASALVWLISIRWVDICRSHGDYTVPAWICFVLLLCRQYHEFIAQFAATALRLCCCLSEPPPPGKHNPVLVPSRNYDYDG